MCLLYKGSGIVMKCPYCQKEMERGIIQSRDELSWIKKDHKTFFGRAFQENSIVLSEWGFFGSGVEAHVCKDCQKVIIDYSKEESDFNKR